MRQVTAITLAVLTLGACATAAPPPPERTATTRGACDLFTAPTQPVKGADRYSQRWADRAVEAGVSGCGWARPRLQVPAKPVPAS